MYIIYRITCNVLKNFIYIGMYFFFFLQVVRYSVRSSSTGLPIYIFMVKAITIRHDNYLRCYWDVFLYCEKNKK